MNDAPEIAGYEFGQRLLAHPLAEVWRGRSFTGMDVVALVLTEEGARDAAVQERLVQAGRGAALEPGQAETPLWAANFTADRPYAITQLVPGQSGAERLIDPLDGVLGNDDESLQAVRAQLSQYGGVAPTPTETVKDEPSLEKRLGGWRYAVVAAVVLVAFTATYSVGAAVGSAVKSEPAPPPAAAAVSPSPLPSPVLLPALPRITTAPYLKPDGKPGLIGATYPAGADLQVVTKAELPFAIGWPRLPAVEFLGESSKVALRRIQVDDRSSARKLTPDARIALHACADLKACTADRAEFDRQWTKVYDAPAPTTAKDARTWLTVQEKPYALSMTRAFESGGQWWLVGTAVFGRPGEEPDVQRILNDIWRQTS
ncbi:hypothetical protein HPO96_17765 [Kribbella sandramycini]|uniref:Uncharacterized protein n=1 Tax=Kribbella sandramycini TaxID=60450 RepID=A0A7Y4NZY8_9ACTN|nr:hypothetical protein [Kribbella sandramycini]MBB6565832.1 hypothetical protein [Kribbella sandramycini]NOL42096.1 hypothetical protein [Kribbella sandramycini]